MRCEVALLKPCRGFVCGAVGACTLWGESVEGAEGAILHVGSVILDGLGFGRGYCRLPSASQIITHTY